MARRAKNSAKSARLEKNKRVELYRNRAKPQILAFLPRGTAECLLLWRNWVVLLHNQSGVEGAAASLPVSRA